MTADVPGSLASAGPGDAFYEALLEDDPAELYDNAPCGYLSALPDGTVVKVNRTFLGWTGYDRDAVLGRRFQELLAPGDRIFYETTSLPCCVCRATYGRSPSRSSASPAPGSRSW